MHWDDTSFVFMEDDFLWQLTIKSKSYAIIVHCRSMRIDQLNVIIISGGGNHPPFPVRSILSTT